MRKSVTKIVKAALGFTMAIGAFVGAALSNPKANPIVAANVSDTINGTTCSSWKSATTSWHDDAYVGGSSGLTYNVHYMGGGNNSDGRTFAWNANGYLYVSGSTTRELVSVTITTTANTKTINVYASNTAYTGSPTGSTLTTLNASTSGATYNFTSSYKYLALKGTASSTFIKSIVVVYGEESVTPELALSKESIAVSKGEDATFVVSSTNLTANFSVNGGNDSYFTTSYSPSKADGNHVVTLHGVEVTASPIVLTVSSTGATSRNISVSVVEAVYFEKIIAASDIKAGREIIIGSTDGTHLLGQYTSGNNSPALDNVPNSDGKLIETNLPEDFALLTIGGSSGAWTLTDQNDATYYGTKDNNYLKAGSSDTWTITITAEGVATITSAASSRSIKYNESSNIYGAYASGQTAVSIYMVPTVDPEIQVTVTGSQSLGVGETATLRANKINGATGTVNWATSNASALALSASTGDEVTVTAGSVLGNATITATLAGCENVVTSFKVRKGSAVQPYTVAEAKAAIDGSDADAKANVYVSGIVSQVDTLNADNSITYWISEDGTVQNNFEIFKGKDLNGEDFSSVNDVEVGATVVVFGNLTKYSTTYELASGNKLISYEAPSSETTINTYLENAHTVSTIHGSESRTSDVLPEEITFADEDLSNGVEYASPFDLGHSNIQFSEGSKYYDTGKGMRVYTDGSFTISSDEDISEIRFTWSGANQPDGNVASVGTYDDETGTWSGNAKSITFTNSGSQWRLQKVEVVYGVLSTVENVALRFGVSIPASSWNGINSIEDTTITDYGVMFLKEATLNGYGKTTVKEAFESGKAVTIKHKGSGAAPYLNGANYLFTIKVSIPASYYGDVICAVPFIKINESYYFMEEKHESVNSLATYYRANGGSDLSNDALDYLKTAH